MRDAACDIGPGCAALVAQLLGDVVEGQYVSAVVGGDLDRERAALGTARDLDHGFALPAVDEGAELMRNIVESASDERASRRREQRRRGLVGQPDIARPVDRDNSRADARQHCLDEGTPPFDLIVGGDQIVRLPLQRIGHPVERGRQRADLVARMRPGDTRRQIPAGYPPRGIDEPSDRLDQPIGHAQRDPHRRRHDEQRDNQQRGVEPQLERTRAGRQLAVIAKHGACTLHLLAEF